MRSVLAMLSLTTAGCLVQSSVWMGASASGDGTGGDGTGGDDADASASGDGATAGGSGDGPGVMPLPANCGDLPPLPADAIIVGPDGNDGLADLLAEAAPGATIALEPGTYPRQGQPTLRIQAPGVTLRSTTGNAADVILDGGGSDIPELVFIAADDALIADLTLQNVSDTLILGRPEDVDVLRPTLYRLVLRDALNRKVAFPGNPERDTWTHAGTVACSTLDMTPQFRDSVVTCPGMSAIRVTGGEGWLVRDNDIRNHWCSGSVYAAIAIDNAARDTVIERNLLIDNYRGILLGGESPMVAKGDQDSPCGTLPSGWGHIGGRVENNVIFIGESVQASVAMMTPGDSMISAWWACDPLILHNTVVNTVEIFRSIEWRYERTVATVVNNVVTGPFEARQGGVALGVQENFTMVDAATTFADPSTLDFRLVGGSAPVDAGVIVPGHLSATDYLGNARVGAPDAGAYERIE